MRVYKKITISSANKDNRRTEIRNLSETQNSIRSRRYSWIPLIVLPLLFVLLQGLVYLLFVIGMFKSLSFLSLIYFLSSA